MKKIEDTFYWQLLLFDQRKAMFWAYVFESIGLRHAALLFFQKARDFGKQMRDLKNEFAKHKAIVNRK